MKEITQEKSLVEKGKKSIFTKIKTFFINIFVKNKDIVNEDVTTEKDVNNEFKESIKMTENEETQLLDLQRRYRRGEIAGNDLTDEQIDLLCNLYDKQIIDLKIAIENTKKQIAEYEKKIERKKA